MPLKENDLAALRNELDRLYKNWVVINGRAAELMEKLRTSATTRESEADALYWKSYGHWKAASPHGSCYGEEISKAVKALDPRWSKTWANVHFKTEIIGPASGRT